MDIRKTINLLESVDLITENEHEAIQNAFAMQGVGELIKYTFDDAQTADELHAGMMGMFNDLYNSMRAGNREIADDMGLQNMGQVNQFLEFAKAVLANPVYYFDTYKGTQNPLEDQGVM